MKLRFKSCSQCGAGIKKLVVDTERCMLVCTRCNADIDPRTIMNENTINRFASLIPARERKHFMEKLGYVKGPKKGFIRTILYTLLVLTLLLSVFYFLHEIHTTGTPLTSLIPGTISLILIYFIYREENRPRWLLQNKGNNS